MSLKSWGTGLWGSGIASPPSDGDSLTYDQATEAWIPTAPSEIGVGWRKNITATGTLAADQTSTPLSRLGGNRWVAPRACTVTAISGSLSEALTGTEETVEVLLAVIDDEGTPGTPSAALLTFTEDGGETFASAILGTPIALAAGEALIVLYNSGTITNTPTIVVDVEITEG